MTLENHDTSLDVIAEIIDITKVCGGVFPDDISDFWRELAIWRGAEPADTPAPNLRLILNSFDEEWDDDFLESDGETPSLGAIETIHALVAPLTREALGGSVEVIDEASGEDDEDDDAIDASGDEISSQEANWSVTSVMNFIQRERLILNPEWQRSFVWKPRKQKALIESMLLGLPIPSFLLYKDRSGKLYVIDGRQRLETISRFMSPKEKAGERRMRFRTFGSKQEGWKQGQKLNPAANKYYDDLPDEFRTQFDTQPMRLAILDVSLSHLYQIFKRYNTGSVSLNAAEIRNAVYQSSPLHQMMFRLGGEHRSKEKYQDQEELRVGEDLRSIMRNKGLRYGTYDFIGRFFAFRYENTGSVSKATNSFMSKHFEGSEQTIEGLRRAFVDAFKATTEWYEFPLTEPKDDGQFHAFLATIQMVASSMCLDWIANGRVSEDTIKAHIDASWFKFSEDVLRAKQNSTTFWNTQKAWIAELESVCAPVQQLSA